MDRQKLFDDIATHLLSQRVRCEESVEGDTMCRYRAGGLKCAFGAVIPDELYSPDMEGMKATALIDDWPEFRAHFEGVYGLYGALGDSILVLDLQYVHDDFSPDTWLVKLNELAEYYRLRGIAG